MCLLCISTSKCMLWHTSTCVCMVENDKNHLIISNVFNRFWPCKCKQTHAQACIYWSKYTTFAFAVSFQGHKLFHQSSTYYFYDANIGSSIYGHQLSKIGDQLIATQSVSLGLAEVLRSSKLKYFMVILFIREGWCLCFQTTTFKNSLSFPCYCKTYFDCHKIWRFCIT